VNGGRRLGVISEATSNRRRIGFSPSNSSAITAHLLTGALLGDDGVVVVDDGLGVERPRPVVLGGAVVVVVTWSSSE
jgi:hypothetical protein